MTLFYDVTVRCLDAEGKSAQGRAPSSSCLFKQIELCCQTLTYIQVIQNHILIPRQHCDFSAAALLSALNVYTSFVSEEVVQKTIFSCQGCSLPVFLLTEQLLIGAWRPLFG